MTELPYAVAKNGLLERVADMVRWVGSARALAAPVQVRRYRNRVDSWLLISWLLNFGCEVGFKYFLMLSTFKSVVVTFQCISVPVFWSRKAPLPARPQVCCESSAREGGCPGGEDFCFVHYNGATKPRNPRRFDGS